MALTRNTKHDHCNVYIASHPQSRLHKISLRCSDHDVLIQWLKFEDYWSLRQAGIPFTGPEPHKTARRTPLVQGKTLWDVLKEE